MRIFMILTMILVCLNCKPTSIEKATDFPCEYQQSSIVWTNASTLIFDLEDLDTLWEGSTSEQATLLAQLQRQPCFEIETIRLIDEERAQLSIPQQLATNLLHYQALESYLHLWYPNNQDEQYYFQRLPNEGSLRRPFYFYWKLNESVQAERIYFRVQDQLNFSITPTLKDHLSYDSFLERGDTLNVISGYLWYQKK